MLKYLKEKTWIKTSLIIAITFIFNACNIQKQDISFNNRKNFFEYKDNPVRLKNMELVDSSNINIYRKELSLQVKPKHYILEENAALILQSADIELARTYSDIQKNLKARDFSRALTNIRLLYYSYPEIIYFSDCLFLEAQAYEGMGNIDSAKVIYNRFLRFSAQKHSGCFHGNIYADTNDTDYVAERNYSMAFINGIHSLLHLQDTSILVPKYFHESFQPGYLENEDEAEKSKTDIIKIFLCEDRFNKIGIGTQVYASYKNKNAITLGAYETKAGVGLKLSTPCQIFKAKNNRFGFKIVPFFSYFITSEKYFPEYLSKSIPNIGANLSIGYYLSPNIALGSYFEYYYFNKQNAYSMPGTSFQFFDKNLYDASMYFNILRHLSIKAGINNNYPCVGIYQSGFELSYRMFKNDVILRISL